jgi:Ca2+ transporting ATPase
MLWVNLIMDSFASLALATEQPKDSLLDRKPYDLEESIINRYMTVNVVSQSIFQIVLLTIIIFYGDALFGVPSDRELSHYGWNDNNGYHFTIFFNIFVFLQVFNSINARKLGKREKNVFSGLFDNYLYYVIQAIIIIGQVLMVQLGGKAVRTKPLSLYQHLVCMGIASLTLVVSLIVKFLPIEEEEMSVLSDTEASKTLPTGWLAKTKSVKTAKRQNTTAIGTKIKNK